MSIVRLAEKFSNLRDYWTPEICGEVGNVFIMAIKAKGDYVWHAHDNEDIIYYVLKGALRIKFREGRDVIIDAGEMYKLAMRTEHLPTAEKETHLMIIEPQSISVAKGKDAVSQIFSGEIVYPS